MSWLCTLLKVPKAHFFLFLFCYNLTFTKISYFLFACSVLQIVLFLDLPIVVYITNYVNKTQSHADSFMLIHSNKDLWAEHASFDYFLVCSIFDPLNAGKMVDLNLNQLNNCLMWFNIAWFYLLKNSNIFQMNCSKVRLMHVKISYCR